MMDETKNWYQWNTLQEFESWNHSLSKQLGFPIPSYNQETGELEPESQWTVTYTTPYQVDGYTIAVVENEYSQGLTKTDLRVLGPDIPIA